MRIFLDAGKCAGHGRCYNVAPDLFEDDERGYGRVIGDGDVSDEHGDDARRALESCPERAISIIE
jgi:ferredoxin